MKAQFYFTLIVVIVWTELSGQKLTLSVEYSNILSRTYFDDEADDLFEFSGYFSPIYNRNKPRKPSLFTTWVFGLDYHINEKNQIGISTRYTQKGQKSHYQYNYGPDTPLLSPLFGGYITYLRHSSVELALKYSKQIFGKGPLNVWIVIEPGIDFYIRNHFKAYFIRKEHGLAVGNSSRRWTVYHLGNLNSKIKYAIDEKAFRLFTHIGTRFDLNTKYRWLTFSSTLGFSGYTRLLLDEDNPNRSFLPDGNILAGNANFGIRINI